MSFLRDLWVREVSYSCQWCTIATVEEVEVRAALVVAAVALRGNFRASSK